MDKKRLNAILEAYGSDPERWPSEERSAALALIAAEPGLAGERRAAAVLDRALAKVPAGIVNDALRTRILETAPPPQARALPRARRGGWSATSLGGMIRVPNIGGGIVAKPLAILAVAICLGLGAGALLPSGVDTASSDTELLTAIWGSPAITEDGANL